jgi:hypothetical protein
MDDQFRLIVGMAVLAVLLAIPGTIGAFIGARHDAAIAGFFLGAILGPLGWLLALLLDNRIKCPQCCGRLPSGQPPTCLHCRCDLHWMNGLVRSRQQIAAVVAMRKEESRRLAEQPLELSPPTPPPLRKADAAFEEAICSMLRKKG